MRAPESLQSLLTRGAVAGDDTGRHAGRNGDSGDDGGVIRFIVIDNHEIARDAVEHQLQRRVPPAATPGAARASGPRLQLVGGGADVTDIDLTASAPDVVVLDLYLGRDDTPSTGWIPTLTSWGARVLLHTSAEFPAPLRRAVAAGAAGLSLKNDGVPALLDAVAAVAAGDFACSSAIAHALLTDPALSAHLTDRELEVVRSLADGLTHRAIGRRFGVAESTVKEHLKSVRAKYADLGRDMSNAHSIVREARRDGWIRDL